MADRAATDRPGRATRAATRLDVVGCGSVVEKLHAPLLRELRRRAEVEVVGCYDHDPAQARRVASALGAQRWGTRAEPVEADGVGAALVATPPAAHAEVARAYLGAGKSVLVEKPFTATAGEARTLVAEARSRDLRIAVDHSWRFYPSVEAGRRFLRGRLGEVSSIEASEGYRWSWTPASTYALTDPYGGVIHDTGSHLLDMVLYLLGLDDPEREAAIEVETVRKVPAREPAHECEARLNLSAAGREGIAVRVAVSRLRPLPRGVKVRGAFGVLFVPTTFALAPLLFDGDAGLRLRRAEPGPEPGDELGCLLNVHLEFLGATREGGRTRTDGSRFLLLSEVLESLHREASR